MNSRREKQSRAGLLGILVAGALMGCLGGDGSLTDLPEPEPTKVNLRISLGQVNAPAPADSGIFFKSAFNQTVPLRLMVLRFTSNHRDTVWDTVRTLPAMGSGSSGIPQGILVSVNLMPFRWWNIEVTTRDLNDSIVHHAVVRDIASRGGSQLVELDIPAIHARFTFYEARYRLPRILYSIGASDSDRVTQKVFFSRLVLLVDGEPVQDSTSFHPEAGGPRFFSSGPLDLRGAEGKLFFRPYDGITDTVTHILAYPYVKNGNRKFTLNAYGFLEGDTVNTPRLLFQGMRTLSIVPGAAPVEERVEMIWVGPKPPPEGTVLPPDSPDWAGFDVRLTVGMTPTVTFSTVLPDGGPI